MAVDFTKLLISPPFQYIFVDQTLPNTVSQLASGAQVFFFKTDKITPKNVYIQTGDPMNPFTVATNPQVTNAAGRLEQPVYLYPFDEADDEPTTEELYYIRVVNTSAVIIDELDDWPQNVTGLLPDTAGVAVLNYAPNYGFDVTFRGDYYGQASQVFISEVGTYPAPGFVWVITDPTVGDFSYTFVEPAIGMLEGDPLHYIVLTEENFGSDQTDVYFAFPICQYQELIGSTFTLQFLAQDQSIVPVTSLDIGVVRSPSVDSTTTAIDWSLAASPVSVGSVALDTSFGTKTLTFPIPDVVVTPDESAATYITIGLPKDQAFKIAMTGWYVYLGEAVTLTVTRDNLGNRYSRTLAQAMNNVMLSYQADMSANLPLMRDASQGAINYQNRTGVFFEAGPNATAFNFAIAARGQNVVRGYSYAQGGGENSLDPAGKILLGNRYLDGSNINLSAAADNSFVVSDILPTSFFIQTTLAHASLSPWSSNTAAMTITPQGGLSNHLVTAEVNAGDPTRVDITFTSNYLAFAWGYACHAGTRGNYQAYAPPPAQASLVNWFGTVTEPVNILAFTPTPGIGNGTINPGSATTPASGFISFPALGLTPAQLTPVLSPIQVGVPNGAPTNQYLNSLQFVTASSQINPEGEIPVIPPAAIQFKVDGIGEDVPVSDTLITVNISSSFIGAGDTIASATAASLNAADAFFIEFPGYPSNGENFFFSSTYKDFIGIFWITNQSKPTNPVPSRPAIYISLLAGGTPADATTATINAYKTEIGAIPTADDLGKDMDDNLGLYMEA